MQRALTLTSGGVPTPTVLLLSRPWIPGQDCRPKHAEVHRDNITKAVVFFSLFWCKLDLLAQRCSTVEKQILIDGHYCVTTTQLVWSFLYTMHRLNKMATSSYDTIFNSTHPPLIISPMVVTCYNILVCLSQLHMPKITNIIMNSKIKCYLDKPLPR